MSQTRGAMFDQVIHYFFQNLSPDTPRDERKSLSYAQELSIEVSAFKDLVCVMIRVE